MSGTPAPNRGQHVLNQRADIRNWPDHIGNRRHHHISSRRPRHRNRRDLVRNRGDRISSRRPRHRNRRHCVRITAATGSAAGAPATETGATWFGVAVTGSGAAAPRFESSFVPSVVSVPPGSSFGFFASFGFVASVDCCWPGCPPEPGESSLVSVPPGLSFGVFFVLRLFRVGGLLIGVGSGIAGTGIGNGDRAPGAHQQARCEHANACGEAYMRQNHDLPPG